MIFNVYYIISKGFNMKKLLVFLATFVSLNSFANQLPTLGEKKSNTTLYACAVSSDKNPYPANGKDKIYYTSCRKVKDQSMTTNVNVMEYTGTIIGFGELESAFFWHRDDTVLQPGSTDLKNYCLSRIDYFKDCTFTNETDITISPEVSDAMSPELRDILNQPAPDLTDGKYYGCAVLLCLANPNGWSSVSECHPPVKKLFRDLWKGKSWPKC